MWRVLLLMLLPTTALADSLVAARVVRARSIVTAEDLALVPRDLPGALETPEQAIGLETRTILYPGRPVRAEDLGPPTLIERNQVVTLLYRISGLQIATEGRALGRAAVGEELRVMNPASRATITGIVEPDGTVRILPGS